MRISGNFRRKRYVGLASLAFALLILFAGCANDVEIGELEGLPAGSSACYASVVYYDGHSYSPVTPPTEDAVGDLLAEVEVNLIGYKGKLSRKTTCSTYYGIGDRICVWEGYDPEFRICGVTKNGLIGYYERNNFGNKTVKAISNWLPQAEDVAAISISDDYPNPIGEITDREVITELLGLLHEKTRSSKADLDEQVQVSYRVGLKLLDGSVTNLVVYNNGLGNWKGQIALPDEFVDRIAENVIFDHEDQTVSYGGIVGENDNSFYPEYHSGTEYVMKDVWSVDGQLRMGRFNSSEYTLLAEDAAGCFRVEGPDIWYLTQNGDAAHIRYWYPGDEASFFKKLEAGEDLTGYVTEREILYTGPFVSMQTRGGEIWTLDEEGVLRQNGEIEAREVLCFQLDGCGVSYGRADGLYRRRYTEPEAVRLTEGKVTAISTAGITLYYLKDGEMLRRMWVDGSRDELVCQRAIEDFVYLHGSANHSVAMLDAEKNVRILPEGQNSPYLVAENVSAIQTGRFGGLYVQYQDGRLERLNL